MGSYMLCSQQILGSNHGVVEYLMQVRRGLNVCASELEVQAVAHPTLPMDIEHYIQLELAHQFCQQEHMNMLMPFTVESIVYEEAAKGVYGHLLY